MPLALILSNLILPTSLTPIPQLTNSVTLLLFYSFTLLLFYSLTHSLTLTVNCPTIGTVTLKGQGLGPGYHRIIRQDSRREAEAAAMAMSIADQEVTIVHDKHQHQHLTNKHVNNILLTNM